MPTLKSNFSRTALSVALDARYVQPGFPGIGRYVYSLAEAMAAQLVLDTDASQINLIYNPNLLDKRHALTLLQQTYPQNVHLIPSSVRPISLPEQWKLPKLARSGRFSLWHAPYYIRPYILPLPTVLTVHDVTSARLPASLPSKKARLLFGITTRLAFLTSRRIIAVSQAAANDIVELYHVRPAKIEVVPHGFDPHFRPATFTEQAAFRTELNLPASYSLYVGINKPHKNLTRLLEAFKQFLSRTNSETVLILAGKEDPRYTAALRQHAANLNFPPGAVRFWGEVAEADLPKLYACSDFLIMPSLYEGFGLPILEAMASGCPVACSNNSSLPEVAGEAAIMFEATEVPQIAAAIERLASDSGLREELREKGLRRAQHFSWQHAAESTLRVYRSLS